MIEIGIKTIIRFLEKIEVNGKCWEWKGCKNQDGYGMFSLNRKATSSHRISYELFVGEIPLDLVIDHLCRNRKCVNPQHLELVTNQENCIRGLTGKNNWQTKKTHCPQGHELVESNLLKYGVQKGWRQCKICHYDWQKKYDKKMRGVQRLR